jgi:hypothetical protein
MRTLTLALLLLLIPSCSDLEGDDDVSSVEVIAAMPENITIAPVPTPTQGLSWTAYSVDWRLESFDSATRIGTYIPSPGQSPEVGFSAYATGPGLPTCTRIGTTHSFNCNGVTVSCPSASFLTLPFRWSLGQGWRAWSDSGSENWVRASAWGLVPTSSNVQRVNDRSVIYCYHDRAGKKYQLKHL